MLNYPVSGFVHPFCTNPIYSAIIKLGRGNDPIRNQFSIMSLFSNNVQGVWYDPSDMSTLFQDAAGTTPVTAVEQPVGLMLDKSKGLVLGSELVTNGDFSNGTTGWLFSDAWSVVSGRAYMNYTGTGSFLTGTFTPVVGKWYQLTFDYQHISGTNLARIGGSQLYIPSATGRYTCLLLAATTTSVQFTTNSATAQCYIDNVSVRELPGNHAFNPSGNSANFPVLSARYNLLTKTEDFGDATWSKVGSTVTTNAAVAPNGTNTADFIKETTSTASHSIAYNIPSVAINTPYKGLLAIRKYGAPNSRRWAYVALVIGSTAYTNTRYVLNIDLQSGLVTDIRTGSTLTNANYSIVDSGDYWTVSLTAAGTITGTSNHLVVGASNSATPTYDATYGDVVYTGDNASGIYVWGADLRVANDALNQPAYQRVNTATDYDTAGFKPYLKFNGTNQWLQTNSIDFSYGDNMFVCAGVRKLSNPFSGSMLLELSSNTNNNNGSFYITAPESGTTDKFLSKGSISALSSYISSAPVTNIMSGISDITNTQNILRINGIQVSSSTSSQGTGNYGNYPLYIGARAGTSLWFNGRLHQLVVAGKQASDSEIGQTEAFINQKTGAY